METLQLLLLSIYLPIALTFSYILLMKEGGVVLNSRLSLFRTTIELTKVLVAAIFYGALWPITLSIIIRRNSL